MLCGYGFSTYIVTDGGMLKVVKLLIFIAFMS